MRYDYKSLKTVCCYFGCIRLNNGQTVKSSTMLICCFVLCGHRCVVCGLTSFRLMVLNLLNLHWVVEGRIGAPPETVQNGWPVPVLLTVGMRTTLFWAIARLRPLYCPR